MAGSSENQSPRRGPAARLAGLGTSVFTEMSALAAAHGAVNLGQGFPDFPAPDFVKAAAKRAIDAEKNQYAPAPGLPRLRQMLSTQFQRRHGLAYDPQTEITVTTGATEGLLAAILSVINPGDEAIVFQPAYDVYAPAIQFAGGVPVPINLQAPDFRIDAKALAQAITPRTRMIVINSPHNPTGHVLSVGELDAVAALAVAHDLIVVSDEVYSEISFDGHRHIPICTRPGMRDRTLTVDSLGKTFSVTGWKVGWVLAGPALTAAVRGIHQFVTFCVSTPFQEAAADALEAANSNGYFDQLRAQYTARRQRLAGILNDVGLRTLPTEGAYFLLADISDRGFPDDVTFCRRLTTEIGVAAIPPSAFYANPREAPALVRFCFAKADATLTAAAERLQRLRQGWC